jgi:mRNA interferase HigB
MKVFGREWLDAAKKKYRDAARAIDAWHKTVENVKWKHPMEVKETSNSASIVEDYVIFNIRGGKYRLVTVVRYDRDLIFVRSFLTHKQYEARANWEKGVL